MSLPYLLQIQALREALERAGRAASVADERSLMTMKNLQKEKSRSSELEEQLRQVSHRFAETVEENRRLRNLVGQVCEDKNLANTELKSLLEELRNMTPKAEVKQQHRNAA